MKTFLEKLDFYGKTPTFNFFGKESAETFLGGIVSFAIFLFFIMFSLIFGMDFLLRKRPKILSSLERPVNSTIYRLSTSDLPILFRIEDFRGNPIDYSNFLYTSILHWEYEEDPNTNQLIMKNHSISTLIKCPNDAEYLKYFTKDPSSFLCFNWDNQTIGGSTEEKFNYYFTFFISFCPTGYYNPDTCTDPNEIDKVSLSKNPWYFSFYYPEYYLQPNCNDNPLKIKYTNYLRRVSREIVKYDEFSFQKVVLNDDRGILWHTNNTMTRLALYSRESEYYYYENNKETLVKNSPALLYQATITMNKDYEYYDRIYVKLQDVAAQIAGFLRMIVFVLVFFDAKASSIFLQASLVHHLFNFTKSDAITLTKYSNQLSIKQFLGNEPKLLYHLKPKGDDICDINHNNTLNINNSSTILSSIEYKLLKYSSIGKSYDERKCNRDRHQSHNHSHSHSHGHGYSNNRSDHKLLMSIFNYGLKFTQYPFCLSCKTKRDLGIKYHYAYDLIKDRMDITYYLKTLLDICFMKNLLFSEMQITAIDNCKRPNINNTNELSSFYHFYSDEDEVRRIREFIEYYNIKGGVNYNNDHCGLIINTKDINNSNSNNNNNNNVVNMNSSNCNNNIDLSNSYMKNVNYSVNDCLNNDPSQIKVVVNNKQIPLQKYE